jgi:hypothetical protein
VVWSLTLKRSASGTACFDLGARGLEVLGVARRGHQDMARAPLLALATFRLADAGDLDHVESELGLHDRAHLVLAQLEHRVLERLHHRAAREPPDVPALRGGAGVLRARLGELGEARRVLARLGRQRLDPLARLQPLAPLRGDVRLVPRLDLVGRDRLAGDHGVERELRVLRTYLLGRLELLRVCLVVRLDRVGRELHLGGEVARPQDRVGDFPALAAERRDSLRGRLGDEPGVDQPGRELPHDDVAAELRLELLLAHVLGADERLVARARELAVLLERRFGGDELAHLLVGRGHPAARHVEAEHAPRDQAVQQFLARRGGVEQRRVEIPAERGPQLVALLVDGAGELGGRDRAAVDLREVARAAEGVERLDPEERERRDDQQQEHDLQQTLVLADEFEHGRYRAKLTSSPPPQCTGCGACERASRQARRGCVASGRSKKKANQPRVRLAEILAERTGLEPATPGVTGRYSNQLNYRSVSPVPAGAGRGNGGC